MLRASFSKLSIRSNKCKTNFNSTYCVTKPDQIRNLHTTQRTYSNKNHKQSSGSKFEAVKVGFGAIFGYMLLRSLCEEKEHNPYVDEFKNINKHEEIASHADDEPIEEDTVEVSETETEDAIIKEPEDVIAEVVEEIIEEETVQEENLVQEVVVEEIVEEVVNNEVIEEPAEVIEEPTVIEESVVETVETLDTTSAETTVTEQVQESSESPVVVEEHVETITEDLVVTDEPTVVEPVSLENVSEVEELMTSASVDIIPEETMVEEPIVEIIAIEEPSMVEESVIETPIVTEATIVEEPVIESIITEEPIVETITTEEPSTVDESVTETPIVTEETIVKEPVVESIATEEPSTVDESVNETPNVIEETIVEEPVVESITTEEPSIVDEPVSETLIVTEETIVEEPVLETITTEEPVLETITTEEPSTVDEPVTETPTVTAETIVEEPVVETIITEESSTVDESVTATPINQDTLIDEPIESIESATNKIIEDIGNTIEKSIDSAVETSIETVVEKTENIVESGVEIVESVTDHIADNLVEKVENHLDSAIENAAKVTETDLEVDIHETILAAESKIEEKISDLKEVVVEKVSEVVKVVEDKVEEIKETVPEIIVEVAQAADTVVEQKVEELTETVEATLEQVKGDAVEIVKEVTEDLVEIVENVADKIIETVEPTEKIEEVEELTLEEDNEKSMVEQFLEQNNGLIENTKIDPSKLPESVPYLIIGAGAAAHSAMQAIHTRDPGSKVLMITEENYQPYRRPPLSKNMWEGNTESMAESLEYKNWVGKDASVFIQKDFHYAEPGELMNYESSKCSLIKNTKVEYIKQSENVAVLSDGREIKFDKCLIATGGVPKNLPTLNNINQDKVTYFRTIDDFKNLENKMRNAKGKTIAIVGGGFLGSELAVALGDKSIEHDFKVTQIVKEKGILGMVLPDYLSEWTIKKIKEHNVEVTSNSLIESANLDENEQINLKLTDGREMKVDHIVAAVGLEIPREFADKSGLEFDDKLGGFMVNSELQARSNVYVAGDATSFYDIKLGRRRVEHQDHAVVSGRLAGSNMTGHRTSFWHQSYFYSDLGKDLGFEAIGLIDSGAQKTQGFFSLNDAGTPDYEKGVVFYMNPKNNIVVGVVTWNVFSKMSISRKIIAEQVIGNTNTLAGLSKLYNLDELKVNVEEQTENIPAVENN